MRLMMDLRRRAVRSGVGGWGLYSAESLGRDGAEFDDEEESRLSMKDGEEAVVVGSSLSPEANDSERWGDGRYRLVAAVDGNVDRDGVERDA